MSLAVYPNAVRGLSFPILTSAKFNTLLQTSPGGAELSIAQTRNPIWKFELIYNFLKDDPTDIVSALTPYTDYQYFRGFTMARQGKFDPFLFANPYDVPSTQIGTNNTTGLQQVPLVTDGTFFYSPIQKDWAGQFEDDVTDLNPLNGTGLTVTANGVPKTILGGDFTVHGPGLTVPGSSYLGMYLKWASTPTPPIKVFGNFYYRVRFDEDEEEIEKFLARVWTIGGEGSKNGKGLLTLVTRRPVGV